MSYSSKIKSDDLDQLFKAILSLENEEECYMFFEDLCTIKELQTIAQRWKVSGMLKEGKTYNEIVEETKASAATISRASKCLNYGAGGLLTILERTQPEK